MDETVTVWEEGRRIDTQNEPSASVPFKHAESTLLLKPDDDDYFVYHAWEPGRIDRLQEHPVEPGIHVRCDGVDDRCVYM